MSGGLQLIPSAPMSCSLRSEPVSGRWLLSTGLILIVWVCQAAWSWMWRGQTRLVTVRTVSTQSQTTYRHDLTTPRFQPLPEWAQGVWE